MERLQDELDALSARLHRSLTLDGPDGELLAHSTQDDDADAARVSSILRRRVAPEVLAWEERHLDRQALEPAPVPANRELGMAARLGLSIRHPGRDACLGYLWMLDAGGPLSEPERAAVRRSASRLADLLDRPQPGAGADRRGVDRLVRWLCVDGRDDAFGPLRAAVPALLDGDVQCAAAVPTMAARTGAVSLGSAAFSALANSLTPALRGHPAYVGSHVATDHLLIVAHRRSAVDAAVDRLFDAFDVVAQRGFGPEWTAVQGIGAPAPFAAGAVRRAARQAVAAAELAALDPVLPRRTPWTALGGYRGLLESRPDDAVLAPLDGAGASAAMLLQTLETYLDLGGDVQATAARLTLHRSSLYYRLDRIARLLDVDLGHGLTRLDLHLALKARRVARRRLG